MKKFDRKSIFLTISIILGFFVIFPIVFYVSILPTIVSNQNVLNMVESAMKKNFGVEVDIQSPVLKTSFSPNLGFGVEKVLIVKDKEIYLDIEKFETEISFAKLFRKNLVLKKFGVDYFYLDVNKISTLLKEPKTQQNKQKQPKNSWSVEWLNALLYAKKCLVLYSLDENTHIKIDCENVEVTSQREPKFVRFDIAIDLVKNNEHVKLSISDNGKVFIKDKKIFVEKGVLGVNNSKVFLDAVADEKNNFDLTLSSEKFDVKNVVELLETNFVIPNGKEILSFFKDIKGLFNLKINMTNKDMTGFVVLNNSSLKIIPLNDLPVFVNRGVIELNKDTIALKDFKGWYGNDKKNVVDLKGTVLDYTKSVDTSIEINGIATDDLMRNYMSKVVGIPLNLTGDCPAQILVKSIYDKMDFTIMAKVPTGLDILVDGSSLSPVAYDRAVKADLHLQGDNLNIKSINYYIANELTSESKGKVKPILTLHGNYDCKNFIIKNLGFKIPNPLPSEFLNVLISQRLFKNGTISGEMEFDNTGKIPVLNGKLAMQKVRIPSQRLSISDASFYTDKNFINIEAKGRFKRSSYDFNGKILNELVFPVIVKDVKLSVDNIDIDRIMQSMNQQNTQNVSTVQTKEKDALLVNAQPLQTEDNEENDDDYTFDTGLIVVEKCVLEVIKGFYKEINFGNLIANLTLDRNGVLDIKSNHFDFAEGISSLKVNCDLKNHNYYIRLGVKDINSDLVASTLLALPREISGKAKGLIELNTDNTFKLNGKILFDISDGTIQKVGLIEYALKFAAVFRNPIAMLSPSLLFDIVNIPEGDFEKINGNLEIKDNVIQKMVIKSAASQLSAFIIGRYDLETKDASMRIYTKFSNKNKGLSGFLRNISLNSLANRMSSNKQNSANYYALELEQIPEIDADEKDCQVFLTKVEGDVEHFNFLSSIKKIK